MDDLLHDVFESLLKSSGRISPTKGNAREIIGAVLELNNPRARLSQTETRGNFFSCLGELFWYLTQSNRVEYMTYYLSKYERYAEKDGTVWGAYGPRIFDMRGINQLEAVLERLRGNPWSRKAVVQLFNAEDIPYEDHDPRDVPCTCYFQFFVRNNALDMVAFMRSNDAYWGLPHDIFCFTMIQETVARTLGLRLGIYRHIVSSLHLYDDKLESAKNYLDEGWQSQNAFMPPMPQGDPWPSLLTISQVEEELRLTNEIQSDVSHLDEYWMDLIRGFEIWNLLKQKTNKGTRYRRIVGLKDLMSTRVYDQYIRRREKRFEVSAAQMTFDEAKPKDGEDD